MKIKWSALAQRDFIQIIDYLSDRNLLAAQRVVARVDKAIALLEQQPYMGRTGRVEETRELVISTTPYIVIYSVRDPEIIIIRFLDARQLWPEKSP